MRDDVARLHVIAFNKGERPNVIPGRASALIAGDAATAALAEAAAGRLDIPAEVQLTFYRTDMCEAVLETCGAETTRVDARTLRKTLTELTSYADLKFGSARGAQKK